VRDAAVRACGTLSSFARKEIEGLTWEDFERLPPDVTALPMTKYLVESMAQANRDAYSQWIREFGGFVGVAQVLMDAETGSAAVPDYAQGTAKWEANLTARRTIRSDNILPAKKMGKLPGVWDLAEALCPFFAVDKKYLLRDFLLDCVDDPVLAGEVLSKRQAVTLLPNEAWRTEWGAQQTRLRLASGQLAATRDAVAGTLRAAVVDDNQLPPTLRSLADRQWKPGEVGRWRESLSPDGGGGPVALLQSRLKLDLHQCVLPGAEFTGGQFPGIDLTAARLPGANLSATNFVGASLFQAQFPGSDMFEARFGGASLQESRFWGSSLINAQFPGALLGNSEFAGSDLSHTKFPGADLTEARMAGIQVIEATFADAVFDGAELPGATVSDPSVAWFKGSLTNINAECNVLPAQPTR
jgi:uncharacterized protein YjbI with pentapeptide repeats